MNSFQVKISVKGTKPPVWRRCIIPGGITFSTLGVLLNEMMDSDSKAPCKFEFYHRGLQLWEDGEDCPFTRQWRYDYLEASRTYVDEFLLQEEWFSYYCGEEASCRIEIEKIDRTASPSCARILKRKGDCPWLAGADCSLEEKNDRLEKKFAVYYPKESVFLKQRELCQAIEDGKNGLPGSRKPKNDPEKLKKSVQHTMKDFADLLGKVLNIKNIPGQEECELPQTVAPDQEGCEPLQIAAPDQEGCEPPQTAVPTGDSEVLLKENFEEWTKAELVDYARELGVLRVSGLKKDELAEKVANQLLYPSGLRRRMKSLTESQLALFLKIAKSDAPIPISEEEGADASFLYRENYIVYYLDETAEVPADLKRSLGSIDLVKLQEERGQLDWMRQCLRLVTGIYGMVPLHLLRRLFRKRYPEMAKMSEIRALFEQIPEEESACCMLGDRVLDRILIEDDEYLRLEELQGDKKYYIPETEEIETFYRNSYFPGEPSYGRLREFLRERLNFSADDTEKHLRSMFMLFSRGHLLSAGMNYLNDQGVIFPDEGAAREFSELLMDVYNHTRMAQHCGFTPKEYAAMNPVAGAADMQNMRTLAMDDMELRIRKPTKIYPNAPCPCGSGKKYKKCCGRKAI